MADCKAGGEKPKDEKGLRAGLVGHVILDRIRDEELVLEEYLQQPRVLSAITIKTSLWGIAACGGICRRHVATYAWDIPQPHLKGSCGHTWMRHEAASEGCEQEHCSLPHNAARLVNHVMIGKRDWGAEGT